MSDKLDDESDNVIRKLVSAKKNQFNEDVITTDKSVFTNWSKIVVPENSNNLIQSYQNFPSLK